LLDLLEGIGADEIGMDCSIVPSQQYPQYSVVSTTDFFYPLVSSPYLQGRIGAANVLSDMYALGVVHIDNVLMILAASLEMDESARNTVTRALMKGFADCCLLAKTKVTGGQSVLNPWPIIGGVAKSMCLPKDFIEPYHGRIGDVLVLTKPLGTQIAVNLHEWRQTKDRKYSRLVSQGVITDAIEAQAFRVAKGSMVRLNRTAAILMHKYGARGATDITGFGPKGHISNLAENQRSMLGRGDKFEFFVDTLPVIAGMAKVAQTLQREQVLDFKLIEGYSAETSGGLLVILPREKARAFCAEMEREDGWPAFVVGGIRAKQGYDYNAENELCVFEEPDRMKVVEVGGIGRRAKL